MAAVSQNSWALDHVPTKLLTANIKASRDRVRQFANYVKIGCQIHTLEHWRTNYQAVGKENSYSEAEIIEYGNIINSLGD
jgi:hypothetical protein